jgi:hypothetical protein
VSVGVKPRPRDLALLPGVLTTGDSMMQSLDSVLGDRLVGRAQLFSDVYISSGLTKPAIVDWSKLPTQQVSEDHPKAAILFLGANEAGPLGDIECCGPDWIAEYARQARRMMHTYLQDGDGSVLWLNNPVPRDERRAPSMAAVNKGLARAARGLDRVRILDMAKLFTPGGVYRDDMRYDGKVIRVRQDDGIHLTIPGARIAATVVLRELHALGVI